MTYDAYSSPVSPGALAPAIVLVSIVLVYNAYSSPVSPGVPAPAIVLVPILTLSSLAY